MTQDLHSNDPRFVEYYERASATERARLRAAGIMDAVLRARRQRGLATERLHVGDIGCNAGTQSRLWLEAGHTVCGIDISRDLVRLAQERNAEFGDCAVFDVASATNLPWPNESVDICLMPELLEHVEDWQACIHEAIRVLAPGGSLYLSTTNVLCPRQQEFNLPFYSWYPAQLKQYCVARARTSSPQIVNFATYPALHWFSPYSLGKCLRRLGVEPMDRFDLIDVTHRSRVARAVVMSARSVPPLRFLAHVCTSNMVLVGHKPTS